MRFKNGISVNWPERLSENLHRQCNHLLRQLGTSKSKDYQSFLRQSEIVHYITRFIFRSDTGLCRGELLGLRFSDINFETGFATIQQQLLEDEETHEMYFSDKLKTKSRKRLIALSPKSLDILKKLHKQQSENKLQYGEVYKKDLDLVICNEDGSPIKPSTFSKRINNYMKRLGYKVTVHGFRHTHLTLLDAAGILEEDIQDRAGHTPGSAVTYDTYVHENTFSKLRTLQKVQSFKQKLFGAI